MTKTITISAAQIAAATIAASQITTTTIAANKINRNSLYGRFGTLFENWTLCATSQSGSTVYFSAYKDEDWLDEHPFKFKQFLHRVELWLPENCPKGCVFESNRVTFHNEEDATICYLAFS